MAMVLLVRHGQASIGGDDYDVLSSAGWEQARALGAYLARVGRRIDRVVAGPLKRQQDTAGALVEAARGVGATLPEPETLPGMAEFPAFRIVARVKEAVAASEPLVAEGIDTPPGGEPFRRAAERIFHLWAEDALGDLGDLERFADFRARVCWSVDEVTASLGRRETALVVTSGGPIGVTVGDVLGLDPTRSIELAWEVYNGSFHEVRVTDARRILTRFNAIPHLEPDGMLTYI